MNDDDLIEQRDMLIKASVGLYDTIQELLQVISGVLFDKPEYDSWDAVMARCVERIAAYRVALGLIKEER